MTPPSEVFEEWWTKKCIQQGIPSHSSAKQVARWGWNAAVEALSELAPTEPMVPTQCPITSPSYMVAELRSYARHYGGVVGHRLREAADMIERHET